MPETETPGLAVLPSAAFTASSAEYRRTHNLPTPAEVLRIAEEGGYVRFVDGRTGATRAWLVPPGDVPAVADALGDDTPAIKRHIHDRISRMRRSMHDDGLVAIHD